MKEQREGEKEERQDAFQQGGGGGGGGGGGRDGGESTDGGGGGRGNVGSNGCGGSGAGGDGGGRPQPPHSSLWTLAKRDSPGAVVIDHGSPRAASPSLTLPQPPPLLIDICTTLVKTGREGAGRRGRHSPLLQYLSRLTKTIIRTFVLY